MLEISYQKHTCKSDGKLVFIVECEFVRIETSSRVPGSVVDIATAYGLDRPGIESGWE